MSLLFLFEKNVSMTKLKINLNYVFFFFSPKTGSRFYWRVRYGEPSLSPHIKETNTLMLNFMATLLVGPLFYYMWAQTGSLLLCTALQVIIPAPVFPLHSLFLLNSSEMKWTRIWYPSGDGTYSDFTRHRGIIRALPLDGILCFYELCAVIH